MHTLNLIATTDIENDEKDKVHKILSRRVFGKCQALFNEQNQSSQCADQIKNVLGRYLIMLNGPTYVDNVNLYMCILMYI